MNEKIKCPKCGTQIPITEVLSHQLNEQVNVKVAKKLEQEKQALSDNIKKQFKEEQNEALKEMKQRLAITIQKKDAAEKKELEFLKTQSELEDKLKKQELEIARKVAEEKKILEEKIRKEENEKQDLKNDELRKQLEDTKKALAEAQRKAQQGSMQTQGEVLELNLEDLLKRTFYADKIEPVPKGISGADILQKVLHPSGQTAGVIAWEIKSTKGWEDKWIEKLKEDGRNIKADACVLVSENLPKDGINGNLYKGVWICNQSLATSVSALLRHGILNVFETTLVNTGKDEKQVAIYDYLSGPRFRQKMEIIIENTEKMFEILETEKKWMTKKWAAEETRIRRLQQNTNVLLGEIQGITSLPALEPLALDAPDIFNDKQTKNPKSVSSDQANLF